MPRSSIAKTSPAIADMAQGKDTVAVMAASDGLDSQAPLCSQALSSLKIARGPIRRAGMALGRDTVRRNDSSLSPGCPLRLSFALR